MKTHSWTSITLFAISLLIVPLEATAGQRTAEQYPERPAHRPAVPGPNGLVTAGHPLASMAGLRTLMAGGNAADAAVATGDSGHA